MTISPSEPAASVDVAVIGAGPAGLSAAVAAAEGGAAVALIDAEPGAGGQFWRHPATRDEPDAVTAAEVAGLHHELPTYRDLLDRLDAAVAAGRVTHLAGHEVWSVQRLAEIGESGLAAGAGPEAAAAANPGALPDRARFAVNVVSARDAGRPRPVTIRARILLVATGAHDLQVPFPGWDLPGVMTAGGAQALLKGHGVLAGNRVAVAGTGPFLLPVASGLARSGATVAGIYEAAGPARWVREPRGLAAGGKLIEGLGYAKDLVRHRIPYRTGWTVLAADGVDRLESITVAPLDRSGRPVTGRAQALAVDVLAVGWGFAPQIDVAVALGCDTAPDPNGLPTVVVDAAGRTSVPGIYAAGEVTGVGGAALALVEGELAGIAVAGELTGYRPTAVDSSRIARLLRRRRRLADFADALYRTYPVPAGWLDGLTDDTVVCRCEEVTAGAIRRVAVEDGATDARSVKLLARAGMGWCQGRICGYATERLARAASAGPDGGTPPGPVPVAPTERAVVTPIPLGLLVEADGARQGPT